MNVKVAYLNPKIFGSKCVFDKGVTIYRDVEVKDSKYVIDGENIPVVRNGDVEVHGRYAYTTTENAKTMYSALIDKTIERMQNKITDHAHFAHDVYPAGNMHEHHMEIMKRANNDLAIVSDEAKRFIHMYH